MPDGYDDEARDALLDKAAQAWEDGPALDAGTLGNGSEDSVSCYLRAYYQRVATEDLAPPSRLAAAAQAHARLGQTRPQGRALVQVREPGDAQLHPVSGSGLVVDIVTDDMPYLVDSVSDRAEPARGRDPAARAPAAAGQPGRGRRAARHPRRLR